MTEPFNLIDLQLVKSVMDVLPTEILLARHCPMILLIHDIAVQTEITGAVGREMHHHDAFKGKRVVCPPILKDQASLTGHGQLLTVFDPQPGAQNHQQAEGKNGEDPFFCFTVYHS